MAKRSKQLASIGDQLRHYIKNSDISVRGLAFHAHVDSGVLYRFLAGDRDMTLATADRVCKCLNLTLVQTEKPETLQNTGAIGQNAESEPKK